MDTPLKSKPEKPSPISISTTTSFKTLTPEIDLDEFLRRELAGVGLEGVRLEPVVTPYWRWGFQSRLRVIADYGGDGPNWPVRDANC